MTALTARLRFWVDVVIECNRRDHTNSLSQGNQRGPFRSARALGMAMAALHDGYALALLPVAKAPLLPGSVGLPFPPVPTPMSLLRRPATSLCYAVTRFWLATWIRHGGDGLRSTD